MENVLKINPKQLLHNLICLTIVVLSFGLFLQFTISSTMNSVNHNYDNLNNQPLFESLN